MRESVCSDDDDDDACLQVSGQFGCKTAACSDGFSRMFSSFIKFVSSLKSPAFFTLFIFCFHGNIY